MKLLTRSMKGGKLKLRVELVKTNSFIWNIG